MRLERGGYILPWLLCDMCPLGLPPKSSSLLAIEPLWPFMRFSVNYPPFYGGFICLHQLCSQLLGSFINGPPLRARVNEYGEMNVASVCVSAGGVRMCDMAFV